MPPDTVSTIPPQPEDMILRLPAVRQRTGLSRSMIYRKMAERTFPSSIKLSSHCGRLVCLADQPLD
jgi:predicted DNA-binding transcriptional regulator AlpA